MLRYRDDVSDCYGVVSPCTNQLRRRRDVKDGGRCRHDEWSRKLWCHLRSNQSLSYRLDLSPWKQPILSYRDDVIMTVQVEVEILRDTGVIPILSSFTMLCYSHCVDLRWQSFAFILACSSGCFSWEPTLPFLGVQRLHSGGKMFSRYEWIWMHTL